MASTLSQWEVGPFNAGMNISMLGSEIGDGEATIIQDMLLDKPGQIYTRGCIQNVVQDSATFNGTNKQPKGFFSTNAPDGTTHLGTVSQDLVSTNLYFTALTDTGNAVGISVTLDGSFPLTSDCVVDAKPALGGGLWIGTQELNATPNVAGRQCLFHWRGATKAAYSTGTASNSSGSAVVTGSGTAWLANLVPGMFMFSASNLIGVVKSVDSNTQVTLEAAVVNPTGGSIASPSFAPIRAFVMEVSKGRIKTQTTTAGVVGSGTKFLSTPFDSGHVFPLYRARDNTWIGSFASATGDEGMTMNASATIALDNELYTARPIGFNSAIAGFLVNPPPAGSNGTLPGIFNTTYAGVQWFARNDGPTFNGNGDMHSRLWFSDYRNQNSVDMLSQDGDFIQVTSSVGKNTPILGLASTQSALLIFKETETFAVTGDSADTFSLNKIWDDGCLSPTSIVQYNGSVIWAGRNGIYIFDGTKIDNLVGRSMGPAYTAYLQSFDPRIHRLTGATHKDHYFLGFSTGSVSNRLFQFTKNGTNAVNLNTLVIYIPNKALSVFSNLALGGSAKVGQSTYYATLGNGYVGDFNELLIYSGRATKDYPDIFAAPYKPDPLFVSKWMSMKDPLLKKMFKQIMATLSGLNLPVEVEVSPGVVDDSTTTWTLLTSSFLANGAVPYTSRIKFLKRDRHIRIKLYTLPVSGFGAMSIRRFAIGYKPQKIGRI